jgi:hypothetical protein
MERGNRSSRLGVIGLVIVGIAIIGLAAVKSGALGVASSAMEIDGDPSDDPASASPPDGEAASTAKTAIDANTTCCKVGDQTPPLDAAGAQTPHRLGRTAEAARVSAAIVRVCARCCAMLPDALVRKC